MTPASFLTGFLNRRVRVTLYPVREDSIDEVITASSRSQKAEDACWTALRTPIPPEPTGNQAESSTKLMLKTAPTMERSSQSKLSRQGEEKHGAVLKM